jgi:hypothetical protein
VTALPLRLRAATLAPLFLLVALAAPAAAQARPRPTAAARPRTIDELEPGTRLRVVAVAARPVRLEGELLRFTGDSLLIDPRGASREQFFRVADVLRIEERYRDRKRGAIAGVATALVGVYAWDFLGPHAKYSDQGRRYAENAIAAAAGGAIGAALGAAIGWPRWRPVLLVR